MASYGGVPGVQYDDMTVIGSTDVYAYADWATTIDFYQSLVPGVPKTYYTIYLQFWTGSSWSNVDSKVGYFQYNVTRSFSLAGRSEGYYRIRGLYRKEGYTDYNVNITNSFYVNR